MRHELSRCVNALWIIGSTLTMYCGYLCYGSKPELPLLSRPVLPRPCGARPEPPERSRHD